MSNRGIHYVVLFPKPQSGKPLRLEVIQKQRTSDLISFICSILTSGILAGIQFLAALLNMWVYIGLYCVIVIGGLISFVYFFTKE